MDRKNHEIESAKLLRGDNELRKYFTKSQIEIMAEAIEDHRGSRKEKPRNIYGKCISDSDRDFDISVLAKRQLATSIKNCPHLETFEEHFERCYEYICGRINKNGVFNLWTNNPVLIKRRDKFQKEYLDKNFARRIYKKEWDRISKDGTKEKIKNYYEDF